MTRSPSASTYDEDFFAWAQEQAAALRDLPKHIVGPTVDIEHVAEEIEDLGKRDLREVTSFLARLLEHLIKIDHAPASRDVPHWRGEALHFQISAAEAFSASMRRAIDLGRLWRQGRKRADIAQAIDAAAPLLSVDCPFSLDELLSEDFDVDRALGKLSACRLSAAADSR